ncbi:MAG TPA: amino acid adenylation domain-containing protein, partial [Thermoanaerobaculia bacterium]|nr:amino acid adenylation domain-containing protein [Thermoanaerobaculia bacterium]
PRTPAEELVAAAFVEVLGVEQVGAEADFFALGGHSLLATRLVSRLRRALAVELPLAAIFERPTVAGLARVVEHELAAGRRAEAPPLVPVPRSGPLPLSFAQERLWFLDRMEPDGSTYNIPQSVRLQGSLAVPALSAALSTLVARHEVLRTTYGATEQGPVQTVVPATAVPLPWIDLTGLPAARRARELARLAQAEAQAPFDLAAGPVLRARLVCLGADDHAVLSTVHHVASDGWSLGVLLRELEEGYLAHAAGRRPALPALPVQYADFAAWQRSWLTGEVLAGEIAWWRDALAGLPPVLELPTDRPRPPVRSSRGGRRERYLAPSLRRGAEELARRTGATPFMVHLAACVGWLARHGGAVDVPVGTPVSGRSLLEVEPLIGFFVNTLVLRGDAAGDPAFGTLLERLRDTALRAFAHQDVPFEKLVEELAPQRALSHTPLFQVLFTYEPEPAGEEGRFGTLALGAVGRVATTAKVDLTLWVRAAGDGLVASLEYAAALFDRTTADRLLARYERLLAAALEAPGRRLSELALLTAAERHQVLREWNDTAGSYPGASVAELFAEVAAALPEAVAVSAGGTALTYGELARRAGRVARRLRALGVGPEVRVGLCVERSPELVAAALGILAAGGAYVPLDPDYPVARLEWMAADAGLSRVVVSGVTAPSWPHVAGVEVLALEELLAGEDRGDDAARLVSPPSRAAGPANLAYVIYTSGSTGRPKGVAAEHRGVVRLVRGTDYQRFAPGHTFLLLAPVSFDASTFELWGPLLNGGRLAVAPPGRLSLGELGAVLRREHVEALFLTSGLFQVLVDERVEDLATLEHLMTGGDIVSPAHVRRALAVNPRLTLSAAYGPTENTTYTSWFPMRSPAEVEAPLPIGRPIAHGRMWVVDGAWRPAAVGVAGELWTSGDGLARGYLGRPGLTAERFVPDPWSGEPGARAYRTGDLVRWRRDGRVDFLGRLDTQVKVRGFRIEPGEVEAVLGSHPGVRECAVVARKDGANQRLVAYVVPHDGSAWAPAALHDHLAARLPGHMVPSSFVPLDALPLTANGKLDRAALPDPASAAVPQKAERAPSTPAEEMVAAAFAEVLGLDAVGAEADFFELGGHSLLATRLVSRLRRSLGLELPLAAVFECSTVEALAQVVERDVAAGRRSEAPPLVPVPRPAPGAGECELPLSFAQERLWFLDRLQPGSAAYNIPQSVRLRGALALPALRAALTTLVARHEVLRTTYGATEEGPVQTVHPPAPLPLPLVELANLPAARLERELARLAQQEAQAPFDLAAGPVLRARLVRLAADDHAVLSTVHHVASDGWSTQVVLAELEAAYEARAAGEAPSFAPLPVQYADFAAWQRSWLAGEVLAGEIAWWRETLAGLPPV